MIKMVDDPKVPQDFGVCFLCMTGYVFIFEGSLFEWHFPPTQL